MYITLLIVLICIMTEEVASFIAYLILFFDEASSCPKVGYVDEILPRNFLALFQRPLNDKWMNELVE